MKFLFMNEYNKEFDFFILRYFTDKHILQDSNLTFERATAISKELVERGMREERKKPFDGRRAMPFLDYLEPDEKLFYWYVVAWKRHPEVTPSTSYFLTRLFPVLRGLDATEVEALEAQLPTGHTKLLTTELDVANEILKFYKRYYVRQLKMEADGGADGRRLDEYLWDTAFHLERSERMPVEKLDEWYHVQAAKVRAWTEKLATQDILLDIQKVLDEHFADVKHMAPVGNPDKSDGYRYSCDHRSEHVRLLGLKGTKDDDQRVLLMPVRGDHLVEEGWQDIAFPGYIVKVVGDESVSRHT